MEKLHRFQDDWTAISEHFRLMFNGMGHLSITEDLLTFRSLPPFVATGISICLLYTSPSPRDRTRSRMPSSA